MPFIPPMRGAPVGVCLVPVTDDASVLWDWWVGQGGEGIVLKERISLYRPTMRPPGSGSHRNSRSTWSSAAAQPSVSTGGTGAKP
jgi:hypothetical protein